MEKGIRRIVIEIGLIIALLVFIIPVFTNIKETRLKTTLSLLDKSSSLVINEKAKNTYDLYPMTDSYATNNMEESIISVDNVSNKDINYNLILKVDKKSTIDLDYFKLKINDTFNYLSDYKNYEDNNYQYYLINSSSLSQNQNEDISYLLWLSEEVTNPGGNLIYSFEVKEALI